MMLNAYLSYSLSQVLVLLDFCLIKHSLQCQGLSMPDSLESRLPVDFVSRVSHCAHALLLLIWPTLQVAIRCISVEALLMPFPCFQIPSAGLPIKKGAL